MATTTDSRTAFRDRITPEEGRALFDRQARTLLGLSGAEFVRRYETGTLPDPADPRVARLAALLPLAR